MAHKLVVVHTTAGLPQANLIKSLLEAAGIPTEISQESAGAVFGFTVGALGLADILVPEEHAAEAKALLEAMHHGELDEGDESAAL